MVKEAYHGPLERVNDCCWRIPKSYKQGMRVDGKGGRHAQSSRKRTQMSDERELRLEVLHEPVIRGDEFALLILRNGDIQTIVKADTKLRSDGIAPWDERERGDKPGASPHDIGPQGTSLGRLDAFLAFRSREGVSKFQRKEVGRQQLVDEVLVIRP